MHKTTCTCTCIMYFPNPSGTSSITQLPQNVCDSVSRLTTNYTICISTDGSVVEFSPATRETQVRFPVSAKPFFFLLITNKQAHHNNNTHFSWSIFKETHQPVHGGLEGNLRLQTTHVVVARIQSTMLGMQKNNTTSDQENTVSSGVGGTHMYALRLL